MNSVILIGRLTKDPDVRYTPNQMAVATFNIAVDRPVRQGEEKKADFPRITVFGRQAENCEKYLVKGRKVAIEGRIQTGSYQGQDGRTVYTTDVVANRVEFLEWGDRQDAGVYQPQAYQPTQQVQYPSEPNIVRQTSTAQQQMQIPATQAQQGSFRGRAYPEPELPPQFAAVEEDVPF